jgi:F0F1-type ATP synthase alpha subunit
MPWVAIKTGIVAADAQETILREYLCDWPGCAHVAEHLVGVVRDAAMVCAVCSEHAEMMQNRASNSRRD